MDALKRIEIFTLYKVTPSNIIPRHINAVATIYEQPFQPHYCGTGSLLWFLGFPKSIPFCVLCSSLYLKCWSDQNNHHHGYLFKSFQTFCTFFNVLHSYYTVTIHLYHLAFNFDSGTCLNYKNLTDYKLLCGMKLSS